MLRQEFLPFLTWKDVYNLLLLNKDGNILVHQHYLDSATDLNGLARLLIREHKIEGVSVWPITLDDIQKVTCNTINNPIVISSEGEN